MSNIRLSHPSCRFKGKVRQKAIPDRFSNPAIEDIPSLWVELSARESIAPEGLRGGIARVRTALLTSIPSWELPSFLDRVQQEAESCATAM